jgi:formamidopyrimidine-DNA glycosylase
VPELPDVEGFRRVLADHAVGRRIQGVEVFDSGVLRGISSASLRKRLRGRSFAEPWRHGKYLFVPVAPRKNHATVVLHFGMTGSLHWDEERHRFDRVAFDFRDGQLAYRDLRKLHGLRLVDEDGVQHILDHLGPDAADLSRPQLEKILSGRRRQLKPTLMDQSVVAGLGNLLVDELLWRARIHPRRSTTDLSPTDVTSLHARLQTVLNHSIAAARVPPRNSWLTGRRDDPSGSCPRCGTTLSHGRVGGRSTTWCSNCQPD